MGGLKQGLKGDCDWETLNSYYVIEIFHGWSEFYTPLPNGRKIVTLICGFLPYVWLKQIGSGLLKKVESKRMGLGLN